MFIVITLRWYLGFWTSRLAHWMNVSALLTFGSKVMTKKLISGFDTRVKKKITRPWSEFRNANCQNMKRCKWHKVTSELTELLKPEDLAYKLET